MRKFVILSLAAFSVFLSCLHAADGHVASGSEEAQEVVTKKYPYLASGSLTWARLADLPEGVLLRTANVLIKENELKKYISNAPGDLRKQLENYSFVALEKMAAKKLRLLDANHSLAKAGKDLSGKTPVGIHQAYFDMITSGITVTGQEMKRFYDRNRDVFGSAELAEIAPQLRRFLLKEKKGAAFHKRLCLLGRRMSIEVSASWVQRLAKLSAENPVDIARVSGKPTIIVFSSKSCCGTDNAKSLADIVREKFGKRANILYLDVVSEQLQALRFNVGNIPLWIFMDRQGKQASRHFGMLFVAEMEQKISALIGE